MNITFPGPAAVALFAFALLATPPAALASTEAEEGVGPAFPIRTEIEILVEDAENLLAKVTLTFPDTGYEVTDWGQVVRDIDRIYVSVEAVRARENVWPMETAFSHEYSFAQLDPGEFTFEVLSRGERLAAEVFEVGIEDMPTAFPHRTDIEIHQNDTPRVRAAVGLTFPHTGYMVVDWGNVERDGSRVYVSVEAIRIGSWSFHMITTLSHEYAFGITVPGEYTFEVWSHGELLGTESFVVEPFVPPPEFPASAKVQFLRDEALGAIAEVTVSFHESGWIVRDWGRVLRRGGPARSGHLWLIYATIDRLDDAELESLSFDRRHIVESRHRYVLGDIEESGEHYLQFFVNDLELARATFVIGTTPSGDKGLEVTEHPLFGLRSFEIIREDDELMGRLGVVLGNSNEVITDWGELQKDGRHLWVDVKAEYAAEVGATVIRTEFHDYPIDELPPGDYTFTLYSRGQQIGTIRHSQPQPGSPAVELTIRNEEGDYFADLAFDPGESGWGVAQWSRLRLATHTFSAEAEIDETAGVDAIQRHSYRLGALHPGHYRFAILGSNGFVSHHNLRIGETDTTVDPFDQWQRARQAIAGEETEGSLLEYAFALDPNENPASPVRIIRRNGSNGGTRFAVIYREPTTAADLKYVVEASRDLLEWKDITAQTLVRQTTIAPDGTPVRELELPEDDHPNRFLRVRAIRSPREQ